MRQLDLFGFPVEDKPANKQPQPVEIEKQDDKEAPGTMVEDETSEENLQGEVIVYNKTLFPDTEPPVSPTAVKRVSTKSTGKRGRKSFKDIDAEIALVEVPGDDELFKKLYYPISQ